MIDPVDLIDLINSGAVDTYRGLIEVMVDKSTGLVFVSQGERLLVMDYTQAADLIQALLFKIGEQVL